MTGPDAVTPPVALVRRPGPRLAEGIVTHLDRSPVDLVRTGDIPKDSTVLYAHLGGQPALNAYHSLWPAS